MAAVIGIRAEAKSKWERRVPLIPADLAQLQQQHGLQFLVQPSAIRIFENRAFQEAGATIQNGLTSAQLILALKEIPPAELLADHTYVFFAHVIKGQEQNMPMLQRLMELNCSLVDYERIVDGQGRRLIFFGVHAGRAGMIETLRALGLRLKAQGLETLFAEVRQAFEYADIKQAEEHLRQLGQRLHSGEFPLQHRPLVIGIAGYGNVSQGAQEMLECLRVETIAVSALPSAAVRRHGAPPLVQVVFKEEDMMRPARAGNAFVLDEYYKHPERYEACFETHLAHLDVLVNAIYWEERYPRLLTKQWASKHYRPEQPARLQVIGDISCDIGGAIEVTLQETWPDQPCFVYDPQRDAAQPGYAGIGPTVMAVYNLPSELAKDASEDFSRLFREMLVHLANADWHADFDLLNLPSHLKRALIVHKGRLTPDYQYLQEHLNRPV